MKAIGYRKAGSISEENALINFEAPLPKIDAHDLLIEVKGISVNPVDVKVRASMNPESGVKVIGYDASGIVKQVGSDVQKFKVGDKVFYAGDITRAGTNSEFHVVDERIVGQKPHSIGFAEAASIPLTAITAWEILFDSFGLQEGAGQGESILIVGGAGGVGSILIQLAKSLTNLTVIATASRPDTQEWVEKMGADYVVNHRNPLNEEMDKLGISPKYVASLTHTDKHLTAIIDLIQPRGHIAVIDDPETLDIMPLKQKSLSISWEFMFARSMFQTNDMDEQHKLLNRVSELLDNGTLIPTMNKHLGTINAENLKIAHELQESGRAIGKTVLEGF